MEDARKQSMIPIMQSDQGSGSSDVTSDIGVNIATEPVSSDVTEPVSGGSKIAASISVGDSETHDPLMESQVCFIIFIMMITI